MKREIKFRAWDSVKREMLFDVNPVTENAVIIKMQGTPPIVQALLQPVESIMQFIGCSDMYGNSIFEGDILETSLKDERVVIEFKGGQFVGKNIDKNHPIGETQNRNWFQWEVIGNIHEHKNLIE